jgi:hypothetical protein
MVFSQPVRIRSESIKHGSAQRIYYIDVQWDGDAGAWIATSDDVIGLSADAGTVRELVAKIEALIPELPDVRVACGDEMQFVVRGCLGRKEEDRGVRLWLKPLSQLLQNHERPKLQVRTDPYSG